MALAAFGITYRVTAHVAHRRPLLFYIPKAGSSTSFAPVESTNLREEKPAGISAPSDGKGDTRGKAPQWKKLSSNELGIKTSMISKSTRIVIRELKKKGFEVYLVGGYVRDLLLKRTPKDFDIITSAELKQVRMTFSRSEIIGRRYPICHVHINDTIVEVSSFSTGRNSSQNFKNYFKRPHGCKGLDYIRWRDSMGRDFTINGLMFDPYEKMIYDYTGGVEDIKKAKVRTIIPASTSFSEDCARILRAVRIAARLGFRFSKEIALAMRELSSSVLRLDKGRILMEMNYMLAYGSGESSLRLLWRFGLLEILMPIQASYFVAQGFKRRDNGSNMLLAMFAKLDKVVAPDRPCHSSLWVAILALHMALVDTHRHPLVVAAFALTLHSSGSLPETVDISRGIRRRHDSSFLELEGYQVLDSKLAIMNEVIDLAASVKSTVFQMTDQRFVSKAMAKFPQAPKSNLVFIPGVLAVKVCKIVECVQLGMEQGLVRDGPSKIDYTALSSGSLKEIRHVLARIVFDTVFPNRPKEQFSEGD